MKIVTFESADADPNMRAMAVIMVISPKAPAMAGEPPGHVWTRHSVAFYGPDTATVRERAQTYWDTELEKVRAKTKPRKGKDAAPPAPEDEPADEEMPDVGDVI